MSIAIALYAGVILGYGLAVCTRRMGERSRELDTLKPAPRPRLVLRADHLDGEDFAQWAERGRMN